MIIYITLKKITENNTDVVAFTWKGKRVPIKQLDRMFAEASRKLNVPEEELHYEIFN